MCLVQLPWKIEESPHQQLLAWLSFWARLVLPLSECSTHVLCPTTCPQPPPPHNPIQPHFKPRHEPLSRQQPTAPSPAPQAFQGVILSAFFGGYAATQVLGGTLADKYGGKRVLATGVALWSLFTFLTPQAASGGAATLLAARVMLGVGEGIAFPSIHSLIGG